MKFEANEMTVEISNDISTEKKISGDKNHRRRQIVELWTCYLYFRLSKYYISVSGLVK